MPRLVEHGTHVFFGNKIGDSARLYKGQVIGFDRNDRTRVRIRVDETMPERPLTHGQIFNIEQGRVFRIPSNPSHDE